MKDARPAWPGHCAASGGPGSGQPLSLPPFPVDGRTVARGIQPLQRRAQLTGKVFKDRSNDDVHHPSRALRPDIADSLELPLRRLKGCANSVDLNRVKTSFLVFCEIEHVNRVSQLTLENSGNINFLKFANDGCERSKGRIICSVFGETLDRKSRPHCGEHQNWVSSGSGQTPHGNGEACANLAASRDNSRIEASNDASIAQQAQGFRHSRRSIPMNPKVAGRLCLPLKRPLLVLL